LEFSLSSETNASPSSIPDLKETKYTEVTVTQTTLSFPPLTKDTNLKFIVNSHLISIVYADEKRNRYFHILFSSIPEEDRLIQDILNHV
jgi:hypothetical protein